MDFALNVRRLARFTESNKVTPEEFAENLFYRVALLETVGIEEIRMVVTTTPLLARSALFDQIATILANDYRFPEVLYGGPGPTAEERERIRVQYQNRVKDFAGRLSSEFKNTQRTDRDSTV